MTKYDGRGSGKKTADGAELVTKTGYASDDGVAVYLVRFQRN